MNKVKKNNFINYIWLFAIILEWLNIILFKAAMGNQLFPFGWYNAILEWEFKALAFYICSAINLLLFCLLTLYHHKRENWKPMMIALFCFATQIFLLIWKIKM